MDRYRCGVCGIQAQSLYEYEKHLESPKHRKANIKYGKTPKGKNNVCDKNGKKTNGKKTTRKYTKRDTSSFQKREIPKRASSICKPNYVEDEEDEINSPQKGKKGKRKQTSRTASTDTEGSKASADIGVSPGKKSKSNTPSKKLERPDLHNRLKKFFSNISETESEDSTWLNSPSSSSNNTVLEKDRCEESKASPQVYIDRDIDDASSKLPELDLPSDGKLQIRLPIGTVHFIPPCETPIKNEPGDDPSSQLEAKDDLPGLKIKNECVEQAVKSETITNEEDLQPEMLYKSLCEGVTDDIPALHSHSHRARNRLTDSKVSQRPSSATSSLVAEAQMEATPLTDNMAELDQGDPSNPTTHERKSDGSTTPPHSPAVRAASTQAASTCSTSQVQFSHPIIKNILVSTAFETTTTSDPGHSDSQTDPFKGNDPLSYDLPQSQDDPQLPDVTNSLENGSEYQPMDVDEPMPTDVEEFSGMSESQTSLWTSSDYPSTVPTPHGPQKITSGRLSAPCSVPESHPVKRALSKPLPDVIMVTGPMRGEPETQSQTEPAMENVIDLCNEDDSYPSAKDKKKPQTFTSAELNHVATKPKGGFAQHPMSHRVSQSQTIPPHSNHPSTFIPAELSELQPRPTVPQQGPSKGRPYRSEVMALRPGQVHSVAPPGRQFTQTWARRGRGVSQAVPSLPYGVQSQYYSSRQMGHHIPVHHQNQHHFARMPHTSQTTAPTAAPEISQTVSSKTQRFSSAHEQPAPSNSMTSSSNIASSTSSKRLSVVQGTDPVPSTSQITTSATQSSLTYNNRPIDIIIVNADEETFRSSQAAESSQLPSSGPELSTLSTALTQPPTSRLGSSSRSTPQTQPPTSRPELSTVSTPQTQPPTSRPGLSTLSTPSTSFPEDSFSMAPLSLDQVDSRHLADELMGRRFIYMCVCGMGFQNQALFNIHERCHMPFHQLTCAMCETIFSDQKTFVRHLSRH